MPFEEEDHSPIIKLFLSFSIQPINCDVETSTKILNSNTACKPLFWTKEEEEENNKTIPLSIHIYDQHQVLNEERTEIHI